MASIDIKKLSSELQEKANLLVAKCKEENNLDILIYCTLRTLEEQAILWRQSRTTVQIKEKLKKYRERGFDFLADILESVGPQNGPHVTDACVGESWHNYGLALDAVPVVNNKAIWGDKGLWAIYGAAAEKVGLVWGGSWTRFKDKPHVQLPDGSNPLKLHSPEDIKRILTINGLLN